MKVYLNLDRGKPQERWTRIGEVLLRLGRKDALQLLCDISGEVSQNSWPAGIAADVLPNGEAGRIKPYFFNGEIGPAWLEAWYSAVGFETEFPIVRDVLATFPWHPDRPYERKHLFVCPEFGEAGDCSIKTDLAVSRWVCSDLSIHRGIRSLTGALGLDDQPYLGALKALGDWPVDAQDTRTHHVVGVGAEPDGSHHVNLYLEPPIAGP